MPAAADLLRYVTIVISLMAVGFVFRLCLQAFGSRHYAEALRNAAFILFAVFATTEVGSRLHGPLTWRTPLALVAALTGVIGMGWSRMNGG